MDEQKEKPMEVNVEAYYAYLERAYGIYHKKENKSASNQDKKKDEGISK